MSKFRIIFFSNILDIKSVHIQIHARFLSSSLFKTIIIVMLIFTFDPRYQSQLHNFGSVIFFLNGFGPLCFCSPIIKLKTFGLEGEKSTRKEGIKLYFRFFQNIATIKLE
jgi:hypothetical protein